MMAPTDSPFSALTRSPVLIGMMGVGKTTIGKRLAKQLGVPFVDSDTAIEQEAGCSVAEIFAREGEPAFRARERAMIERLLSDGQIRVIATGGGAFIQPACRAVILDKGLAVWLQAEVDTLLKRIGSTKTRPLLQTGNPRETIEKMLELRAPVYALAPKVVRVDYLSFDGAVEQVLAVVKESWAG